jgi:proteasome accessory factor B
VSRKSERLVNLTIALLATKRYLTKSEIFRTVAGYTGDVDARDRMFERDKDDLRSLGIEIELGSFDPLFEDEPGYRIKEESYQIQLDDLDPASIALLSQASKVWRTAALSDSAQTGLRKLKSIGIESDEDLVVGLTSTSHTAPEQLPEIIEAISERREITFNYLSAEMKSELRKVQPYRLSNSRGYWYLIGCDVALGELRTFRLDRFDSSVEVGRTSGAFEADEAALDNEDSHNEDVRSAEILVRKGKAPHIRSSARMKDYDEEWDLLEVQYHSESTIIREVLWAGDNAKILSPRELQRALIDVLQSVVASHG